jgi:hypothetical protein
MALTCFAMLAIAEIAAIVTEGNHVDCQFCQPNPLAGN